MMFENFSSNLKRLFPKHFLSSTLICADGKKTMSIVHGEKCTRSQLFFHISKVRSQKHHQIAIRLENIRSLERLVPETLSWKQTTDKKYSPWRLYNGNIYKCTVSFSIFSFLSPSPLSPTGLLSGVSKPRFRIFSFPPFFLKLPLNLRLLSDKFPDGRHTPKGSTI